MQTSSNLVSQAQKGCQDSFRQLVLPLEPRLFNLGLGLVGNRHDADDLWQNALLKAWRHLPKLRNPEQFKSWLATIVISEAKNLLGKRRTLPLPTDTLPEGQVLVDIEASIYVHQCLHRLPQDQREVVVLRFWGDLQLADIAAMLNIPVSTTKTRLYQGMGQLQKMIGEEAKDDDREHAL